MSFIGISSFTLSHCQYPSIHCRHSFFIIINILIQKTISYVWSIKLTACKRAIKFVHSYVSSWLLLTRHRTYVASAGYCIYPLKFGHLVFRKLTKHTIKNSLPNSNINVIIRLFSTANNSDFPLYSLLWKRYVISSDYNIHVPYATDVSSVKLTPNKTRLSSGKPTQMGLW